MGGRPRGRCRCSAVPAPPPGDRRGPADASAPPYAEGGASRLSPPCCSEGGHEVGGPPNLCPRLQSPLCWLPRSPLPFAAVPPSRRVAGSPSGPAPAPAGGSWTEVPSTSCGCGFLGPSECCLRAKDTPVTQETPGIQELSQQGVWTGTSRYPRRCFTPGGARVPPPNSYQQQAAGACGQIGVSRHVGTVGGLGLSWGDDLLLFPPPQGWAAGANLLRGGTSGRPPAPERLCWMLALWDQLWRRPSKWPAWPTVQKVPPPWARPASPDGMVGRERKAPWHFKNVSNLKTAQGNCCGQPGGGVSRAC